MKKIILLSAVLSSTMLVNNAKAQDTDMPKGRTVAPSRDHIMLQLHYDNWAQQPDSINATGINRGFNAYFMYDFPWGNSNFSFAPGLGIGTYNYYFKNQRPIINQGLDEVRFQTLTGNDSINSKRNKLTTAYLEVPLELRYFSDKLNRNRGFKAAIGLKVGYLIDAHTKEKMSVNGLMTTFKAHQKSYFQTWNFSPTLRLGWGNYAIFGQYNLSQQFMQGKGPEMYPWSVGISISGM